MSKYSEDDIYQFIEDNINEGAPPTLREIGAKFSIPSTSHVRYILDSLVQKGLIRIVPLKSRGIRLVKEVGDR